MNFSTESSNRVFKITNFSVNISKFLNSSPELLILMSNLFDLQLITGGSFLKPFRIPPSILKFPLKHPDISLKLSILINFIPKISINSFQLIRKTK